MYSPYFLHSPSGIRTHSIILQKVHGGWAVDISVLVVTFPFPNHVPPLLSVCGIVYAAADACTICHPSFATHIEPIIFIRSWTRRYPLLRQWLLPWKKVERRKRRRGKPRKQRSLRLQQMVRVRKSDLCLPSTFLSVVQHAVLYCGPHR